ncbi:MAG: hypothetical protein WCH34_14065 [Bacteroidota bacterium]
MQKQLKCRYYKEIAGFTSKKPAITQKRSRKFDDYFDYIEEISNRKIKKSIYKSKNCHPVPFQVFSFYNVGFA